MHDEFKELIRRYNQGLVSPEEKKRVERWYLSLKQEGELLKEGELERIFDDGLKDLQGHYIEKRRPYRKLAMAAAAVIALFVAFYWNYHYRALENDQLVTSEVIVPGGNQAYLKFSDDQVLNIKDISLGSTRTHESLEIERVSDGKIQLRLLNSANNAPSEHIVKTPVGGEIEVVLPDGSTVMLNADSELRLTSEFNLSNRKINLSGEAYFDVQPSTKPFIVSSNNQEVTVLGTEFNIKAYPTENTVTTNLITGSLKINRTDIGKEVLMEPGDQVVNQGEELEVAKNQKHRIDWVEKEIVFNEKTIEEIMNDLARWYDVEVYFEDSAIKNKTFTGTISRYSNFTQVIEVLERTESLKFHVEGRKVRISN